MKLFPGYEAEYRRRHSTLWPELQSLLKETGIREYSIFLEEHSLLLFAYLVVDDPARLEALPDHPVMQRWWDQMKDIMESHPDHSPMTTPLQEVFYMP